MGCSEDQTEAAPDTWGDHRPKWQILRAVSPAQSAYCAGPEASETDAPCAQEVSNTADENLK